ncbi:MAG: SDR family oxidoreductase [bacterium]|nr:SDR family oxidoreductase [bacterium]
MKVLVVGGAGYIGGAVTDILADRKIPFAVYDNLLYEDQYFKPVNFVYGDVRDSEKLGKLLKDYTHVIWLAAIVGDAACQVHPELTIAINQKSVEWLANNFDGRILFLSTCSVYGANDEEVNEESELNPLSLYAETKAEAEKFLADKDSVSFRLGTVFGVSDSFSRLRMDLVVNYMTANALTKGKLSIFGGTQWRPLIHVRNVAEAMVNALYNKKLQGVYNLSTLNYQIKDLGKEVAELTGCDIEYVQQQFEDKRNYHVSTKKAEEDGALELEKVLTIKEGAGQIADLIKSGRVKYTEKDIYFNERHIAGMHTNGELK